MASETQKLTVGITGATGRLATILIRQFKGKYHLRLFSFEKPECASSVLLYSITHSTRNTLSGTDKETLTTEKEHYDTTVVDLSRREEVAGRSTRHHSDLRAPLFATHIWHMHDAAGLFEGIDVLIHLAAYTLPEPFPEQGRERATSEMAA